MILGRLVVGGVGGEVRLAEWQLEGARLDSGGFPSRVPDGVSSERLSQLERDGSIGQRRWFDSVD
eukprot:9227688-Pyramimonas_sp.AAC.1